MKLLTAAVVGVALSSPSLSNEAFCQVQAKIAEKIMDARQSGVALSRMMEINDQMAAKGDERPLYDEMVMLAYEEPLYNSASAKQRTITEFGNFVMLQCLRGAQSGN